MFYNGHTVMLFDKLNDDLFAQTMQLFTFLSGIDFTKQRKVNNQTEY